VCQPLGSGRRPDRTEQRYLHLDDLSRRAHVQNSCRSKTRLTGTVNLVPTPHQGTPRYRLVAEELRRRIEAGAIPAGALLPPESALVQEFGISRGTAREAIAALRAEGLVVTEHGRGTYVRPKLPVRRVGAERYKSKDHHCGSSSFKSDAAEAVVEQLPAVGHLAELFEVVPGAMLERCRIILRIHGVPHQLTTSYRPADLLPATGEHSHIFLDCRNLTAQLTAHGINVTKIRETVRARMPTSEESLVLGIPAGTPTLTVTRRTYAGLRVVEVAQDIVLPADRTELEYEFDLR